MKVKAKLEIEVDGIDPEFIEGEFLSVRIKPSIFDCDNHGPLPSGNTIVSVDFIVKNSELSKLTDRVQNILTFDPNDLPI